MNFKKAVEFVRSKGSEEDVERLECILDDRKPKAHFIEKFARLQNADGGFPLDMQRGNPSTLLNSSVVLGYLEDFNSLQTDIVKKTTHFFFVMQSKDGSWNESESIIPYNPPPWMDPRNINVRILSTANTGFWLAKLGYSRDKRIEKACDYLANYRKENGAFEGFRHNTWIAASLFAMLYGRDCKITRDASNFLLKIPEEQWVSSQISWMLSCFRSANFTKEDEYVRHFLDLLSKSQSSDGSFESEDGVAFSVNATLETIKVFKHFETT